MRIPITLGLAGIGQAARTDRISDALRRMQGSGYSSDADSARVGELRSMAVGAGVGANALDRAAFNAIVGSAVELLRDHELERWLPNDAARTPLERQERLQIIARTDWGAVSAALYEAIGRLDPSVTLDKVLQSDVAGATAEPQAIHNIGVLLADAAWENQRIRETILDYLRRVLPAANRGHRGALRISDLLCTDLAPNYASATHRLGRTYLDPTDAATEGIDVTPARHYSYGPASPLRAQELNAIQDYALIGELQDAVAINRANAGGRWAFVSKELPVGTTVLDSAEDWRLKTIALIVHTSASNILPGGASDSSFNGATVDQWLWFTGAGGASYQRAIASGTISLQVNAATHDLEAVNGAGATRYLCGFLIATLEHP